MTEGCFETGQSIKAFNLGTERHEEIIHTKIRKVEGEEWRQRKQLLPRLWHIETTERRPLWLDCERERERVMEDEVIELGSDQVGGR